MTAWAVKHSRRIFLAGLAAALVAYLLALMVSTVKGTTTLFLAGVLWLSTKHILALLATEAINHLWKIAGATGT